MRDRVVFFTLGALLATLAYFAGDLETLTAQDKTLELESLKVDRLHVADIMHVGGNGRPFVRINVWNKSAEISLVGKGENAPSANMSVREGSASVWVTKGGEDAPEASMMVGEVVDGYADIKLSGGGEDAPRMRMRVEEGIGVSIDGMSHAKRPEALFDISTVKQRDGAFRSGILIKDSRGTNNVDPVW